MHKKPPKKELCEAKKKENKMISKVRVMIERCFGTLKTNYCFFRSKYLGIAKTTGQFLLSAIAYNLKKASMLNC